MSCQHQPSSLAESDSPFEDKEWSVEEVASLQAASSQMEAETAADTTVSPVPTRPVSGRYRGVSGTSQLELRVDVDGRQPMRKVSGDLFQVSGATVRYLGSFLVNAPTITAAASQVRIRGTGSFSFSTPFPVVTVTIPRTPLLSPPASARVSFSASAGAAGSAFDCPFVSPFFRTVQYEEDSVSGTTPFASYNTALRPSGGPARVLSVLSSFAEAGIEMQPTGRSNVISRTGAGIDSRWSDAELHASMQTQFSVWRDDPQWKVWLLLATMHEIGPTLRGIMFDQRGRQRQGCAVFHDVVSGDSPERQRAQLRTYVHELGHCFNLMHSWQKSLASPPVPDRLNALSWMNYVDRFPGGEPAYWSAFPFQFDNPELVHLRHGFRDNVIMGGNPFGIGAADLDLQAFSDPLVDNSGLRLELEARPSFVLCEPVVVEVKLYTTDLRGRRVHEQIHPNYGFVQIAIQKPGGNVEIYQPLVEHCVESEMVVLDQERPSIYTSAYIGYGKGGFYFGQPGYYQVRAIYHAPDGSQVVSNVLPLRVGNPRDKAEDEIADLYYGDDQGKLFYLLGSDSQYLASGNTALDTVIDRHGKHPLSVYARLTQGLNAGRNFKTVTADKELYERPPEPESTIETLSPLIPLTQKSGKVDNITLNMAMRRLARAHKRTGDEEGANKVLDQMVKTFEDKGLKPHVLKGIEAQADKARAEQV
jgi:hypothetical protein